MAVRDPSDRLDLVGKNINYALDLGSCDWQGGPRIDPEAQCLYARQFH